MTVTGQVRWGIVGTAKIARTAFLPGLRVAGGVAAAVAARDLARAQDYAHANVIGRAIEGYQNLIDDPDVDALYIPLPNGLHAEWTIQALRAGKPVLCEKPLCGSLAETERVLGVAQETGTLLWESFVFPFHAQMERIRGLLADGAIGELREIQSDFHFRLDDPANIRMTQDLAGGALNDVGCYPVRLARELFGDEHESAWATARWGGGGGAAGTRAAGTRAAGTRAAGTRAAGAGAADGVDVDTQGSLGFPGGRRLLLSCGFGRSLDTFSRLLGTGGQIHVSNAFHPGPDDHFEVFAEGTEPRKYQAAGTEPSFTAAIAHIQAVIRGEQAPRSLAIDTSLGSAQALHDLRESAATAKTSA
jgi:predicted dehydrogenase